MSEYRGSVELVANVIIVVITKKNLCDHPGFTGYQIDGGYAELACAKFSLLLQS